MRPHSASAARQMGAERATSQLPLPPLCKGRWRTNVSRRGCRHGAGEVVLHPSARSYTLPTTPQSGPAALPAPLTQGSQALRGTEVPLRGSQALRGTEASLRGSQALRGTEVPLRGRQALRGDRGLVQQKRPRARLPAQSWISVYSLVPRPRASACFRPSSQQTSGWTVRK